MPQLHAQKLAADPRVAQAKQLIADALADAQQGMDGVRPADPDRAASYNDLLEQFGTLRGGKLWYPYIGSGIGHGPLVELADGSVKFDMINGIGVHGLGHSDAGLIAAGIDGAMGDTVMQGNLQANADSMHLCEALLKLANQNGATLDHCFLTTSGAMANENALKMVFQKHAPADRILAFSKCFTGRTIALAAITDKAAYRDGLPATLNVGYLPYVNTADVDQSIASAVKHLHLHLNRYKGKIAGVMFELVQGEGGYNAGDARFHKALMEECKTHGLAVFADEIQTFGRTLQPFAFQHYGLDDYIDVVSVGKMSQVCATLFKADYAPRPGLVSQTFTGASPQIHAAMEVVRRMDSGGWFGDEGSNATIRAAFERGIQQIHAKHPTLIGDTLFGVGTMMAFQVYDGSADKTRALLNGLFENGVIAFVCGGGPYRVRFLPPAAILTQDHVEAVCRILEETLVQVDHDFAQKQGG